MINKEEPKREETLALLEKRIDEEIKKNYPNGCFVVLCVW